ncbi:MAG: hypothetical protein Q7K28_01960 [Candidatus Wildermuthbacteria bacterium]|nr:hypothetical protein [Candidatus Wildermuthbacteria bacterium]
MKKFLSGLVLLSILAVLVVPVVASAQSGPGECCKLSRDVKWTSGKIDAAECTTVPTPAGCSLTKGQTIGPSGSTCSITNAAPSRATEQWGIICILDVMNTIVDWIFTVMVILAVLFSILGAFNLLTGAGAPDKITSGRNYILYAAIGLLVALIARAIPGIVKSVMGY